MRIFVWPKYNLCWIDELLIAFEFGLMKVSVHDVVAFAVIANLNTPVFLWM
jgi:hypothetical protein